jgi:hypothetical protein
MEVVRRVDEVKLASNNMTKKMLDLVPEHYLHHCEIVEEWAGKRRMKNEG